MVDNSNFHVPVCSSEEWDVVIIGAGLAGLYTALLIAESGKQVLILAKSEIGESNTDLAQGGIAASISEQDSPLLHMQDTLTAGVGLCDAGAVRQLVEDGPSGVKRLINMGVKFDHNQFGLALTKEGAHSQRRILHARGDSTGRVIREALTAQLELFKNITVRPNTFALDLQGRDQCTGLITLADNKIQRLNAANVVIASGGACRMFQNTTNPQVATGDGIAMAWRAGASLADMEFIQFHPTALMLDGAPRFLISEAVRGEGALLRNCRGERFMPHYHPQAELAPRDVVARAMVLEMEKTGSDHLWLDLKPMAEEISSRFPTIYARCTEYGLVLPRDMIPVAPAAHYFIGGIVTDNNGRTNVPGLYACGEASCTGVHGANRLASNSLLEALVYGQRIAHDIAASHFKVTKSPCPRIKISDSISDPAGSLEKLRETVWRCAGLKRDGEGLVQGLAEMAVLGGSVSQGRYICRSSMELHNMLTLATLVAQSALLREESRGGHYRSDFPQRRVQQLGHWILQRNHQPLFSAATEEVKV